MLTEMSIKCQLKLSINTITDAFSTHAQENSLALTVFCAHCMPTMFNVDDTSTRKLSLSASYQSEAGGLASS